MVDDEDFDLVSSYKWRWYSHGKTCRAARPNCHTRNGEWHSKNALLHRFILKAKIGQSIDHIDGDGLNNQKSNLRFCTHAENMRNHPKKCNAKSAFKGLNLRKNGLWRVRICLNRKRFHIGDFHSEKEAALAYNMAAHSMFGQFARLNEL